MNEPPPDPPNDHRPRARTSTSPRSAPAPFLDPGAALPDIVTEEQRAADFAAVFTWRGQEIRFSLASELYFRELRVRQQAPPMESYLTLGDFAAEAPRILFVSHLSAADIRTLRAFSVDLQLIYFDKWTETNLTLQELPQAAKTAHEIMEVIARAKSTPISESEGLDGLGNLPSHLRTAISSPTSPRSSGGTPKPSVTSPTTTASTTKSRASSAKASAASGRSKAKATRKPRPAPH